MRIDAFERQAVQRRRFTRDAVVPQAIRAVRSQLGVEQRSRRCLLQRLYGRAGSESRVRNSSGGAVRSTNSFSQL